MDGSLTEETLKAMLSFIAHKLEANSIVMEQKKYVLGGHPDDINIFGPFTEEIADKFIKEQTEHNLEYPSPYFWHEYTVKPLCNPYSR